MARNPRAYIRIRGNGFDFRCYLGNGRAKIVGGGAEYEAQRRPQSDAATLYTGNGLLMVDVPVLFDGWGPPGERRDIEPRVEQVRALAFGRGKRPPPSFVASGPFPGSGERFQMALPEELDEPRSIVGEDGVLYRQALMLKLVEYNDPTAIEWKTRPGANVGKARNGGIEAPPRSIVLDNPQTLLQVSSAVYGTPEHADILGDLNDIKDLRKKLPAGRRIKLPAGWPGS